MEIVIILLIVLTILVFIIGNRCCKFYYWKGYWKGRCSGWIACETLAAERAKKCNYDMEKFYSDILQ